LDATNGKKVGVIAHRSKSLPGYVYSSPSSPTESCATAPRIRRSSLGYSDLERATDRRFTGELSLSVQPRRQVNGYVRLFRFEFMEKAKAGGRKRTPDNQLWAPYQAPAPHSRRRNSDWMGKHGALDRSADKRRIASWNPATLVEDGIVDYSSALKNQRRQDRDRRGRRMQQEAAGRSRSRRELPPIILWIRKTPRHSAS